jgi:hypothetical protein
MQDKLLPGEPVTFLVYRYPYPGASAREGYQTGWVSQDYPESSKTQILYHGPSGAEIRVTLPRDKVSRFKN